MPIYHHFYIERRRDDGWIVPAEFKPEAWTFECDWRFGGFAWAHPSNGWLELFKGADGLFRFRSGPPDDRRGSPLLRYLDGWYDYEGNEDHLCWIPFEELFVDFWDVDKVTVRSRVQARHALLFGDGQRPFPRAELVAAGVEEDVVERYHQGEWVDEPVDVSSGKDRSRLNGLPGDSVVEVTWRDTISEFIGEPLAGLFKGLRQYGRDEDLRVLSRRG